MADTLRSQLQPDYGTSASEQSQTTELHKPEGQKASQRLRSPCCACKCLALRYVTAVMISLGLFFVYGVRTNSAVTSSHFRYLHSSGVNNTEISPDQKRQWTPMIIGWVDNCNVFGFVLTNIPGGILANKYSSTKIFSATVVATAVVNLLLPLAFKTHFAIVIAIRIVQGLCEGCALPSSQGVLRYWCHALDRSRLTTIANTGVYVGTAVGLLGSGVLADRFGWPVSFYVYGVSGIIWFCVWQSCIFEKPSVHPCITEEELKYIEDGIGESMDVSEKISELPWSKIFTSVPFYALVIAYFARKWTSNLLAIESYKYFSDIFEIDNAKNGIFSALPHATMALTIPIGGQLADEIRKRGVSTTVVRKMFFCCGYGLEAAFLIGIGLTTNMVSAAVCLGMTGLLAGFGASGYSVNVMDIAPRCVSILWGLLLTITFGAGFLVPLTTMELVKDHSHASWLRVFIIAASVHAFSVIIYALFASGEKQQWAKAQTDPGESEEELPDSKPDPQGLLASSDSR